MSAPAYSVFLWSLSPFFMATHIDRVILSAIILAAFVSVAAPSDRLEHAQLAKGAFTLAQLSTGSQSRLIRVKREALEKTRAVVVDLSHILNQLIKTAYQIREEVKQIKANLNVRHSRALFEKECDKTSDQLQQLITELKAIDETLIGAFAKSLGSAYRYLEQVCAHQVDTLKVYLAYFENILSSVNKFEGESGDGSDDKHELVRQLTAIIDALNSALQKTEANEKIVKDYPSRNVALNRLCNSVKGVPKNTFDFLLRNNKDKVSFVKTIFWATSVASIINSVFYHGKPFEMIQRIIAKIGELSRGKADSLRNYLAGKTPSPSLSPETEDTTIAPSITYTEPPTLFWHDLNLVLFFLFVLLVVLISVYFAVCNPFRRVDDDEVLIAKNVFLGRKLRRKQSKSTKKSTRGKKRGNDSNSNSKSSL